jgi:endogenous inhibitor of DNA gyrase (YacG/DUF329 family)
MTEAPTTIPCPTCRRPVPLAGEQRPKAFPFCSARCRTTDLGAWATGGHVIAGTPLSLDGYDADLDHLLDADPDRS